MRIAGVHIQDAIAIQECALAMLIRRDVAALVHQG
jgi:hypothetical protein